MAGGGDPLSVSPSTLFQPQFLNSAWRRLYPDVLANASYETQPADMLKLLLS